MLTDNDFKKLMKQIKEILNDGYKDLRKDLKANLTELKAIRQEQKELRKDLQEFLSIMKHFAREQKILIKKMREIEHYFDPPGRN